MVVVALAQLGLGLPHLLAGGEDHALAIHASHHLGAWDVAFAVGLLVIAIQPWRTRGFLPMATALVTIMVVTAVLDIANNRTPGMTEAAHLLELAGLVLAWALSRTAVADGPGGGRAASQTSLLGPPAPSTRRQWPLRPVPPVGLPPDPAVRDRRRRAA